MAKVDSRMNNNFGVSMKKTKARYEKINVVGGVVIRIHTNRKDLSNHIAAMTRNLATTSAPKNPSEIQLFLYTEDDPSAPRITVPPSSRPLYIFKRTASSELFESYRTEECLFLRIEDKAIAAIDIRNPTAVGVFTERDQYNGWKGLSEIFYLVLYFLLTRIEIYPIHAAVVSRNGQGILIAGHKSQGKTTTALFLTQAGWRIVSDDISLLAKQNGNVTITGFRRKCSIRRDVVRFLPKLEPMLRTLKPNKFGKFEFDPSRIFPTAYEERVQIRYILFPEILDETRARLEGISQSQALMRLGSYTGTFVVDDIMLKRQFEILLDLLKNAQSFRLYIGNDAESLSLLVRNL
jgi:hypothetical protein